MNLYEIIYQISRNNLPHANEWEIHEIMNRLQHSLEKEDIKLNDGEINSKKNVPFILYIWLRDNWTSFIFMEIYDYIANEIRINKLHTKKADNQNKDINEDDILKYSNGFIEHILEVIKKEYLSDEDIKSIPRQEHFKKTLQKYNPLFIEQRGQFNEEIQKYYNNPNLLFTFEN